jgi:hypothetical protein
MIFLEIIKKNYLSRKKQKLSSLETSCGFFSVKGGVCVSI